jgi:hypothetical protein
MSAQALFIRLTSPDQERRDNSSDMPRRADWKNGLGFRPKNGTWQCGRPAQRPVRAAFARAVHEQQVGKRTISWPFLKQLKKCLGWK